MKKYFYGDFVFNEDYKCEVVETWEYNENEESDDDKWELLDTYPLTKGYEDIYFEQFPNITPSSEYYMFCEISKDEFKKMKEDYEVYNNLLDLVGETFDYNEINFCFRNLNCDVIINELVGLSTNFSSFSNAYIAYYNYKESKEFMIYTDEDNKILSVF